MKKRTGLAVVLIAFVLLFAVFAPVKKVDAKAKTKCWYGKYCDTKEIGRKAVKFKGNRVIIRGKWENFSKRNNGGSKEKKTSKRFRLTKKTRYYIENTVAQKNPVKKVSKAKFLKKVYSDVSYCAFKVSHGKVTQAWIILN